MTMHCHLCLEVCPVEDIVDHMRIMHPDLDMGRVTISEGIYYPDGSVEHRSYQNTGHDLNIDGAVIPSGVWTVRWDR